jgi:hypothetical protein
MTAILFIVCIPFVLVPIMLVSLIVDYIQEHRESSKL